MAVRYCQSAGRRRLLIQPDRRYVLGRWLGRIVCRPAHAAAGGVVLAIYKTLEGTTRRERSHHWVTGITATVPPPDCYSFLSGYTLNAASFTVVALHYYPLLAWILVPSTLNLVASARVILGLHYPGDVLAALGIWFALGYAGILLLP